MIDFETKEDVFFSATIVKNNGLVHKFRITAIPVINSFTAYSRHFITNDFEKYYEISNVSKQLTQKQFETILNIIENNEELLLVSDMIDNSEPKKDEQTYQAFYFACDKFEKEIKGYDIFDEDDSTNKRNGMDTSDVYTVSDVVGQIIGYLQSWFIWTVYPYLLQEDLNNQLTCFEISARFKNKTEVIYTLYKNIKNSTYFFANREIEDGCLEEKWITPVSKDCYDSIVNIISTNKELLEIDISLSEQKVVEPYQKVIFRCDSFEKQIDGYCLYFPNMFIKRTKEMENVNSVLNDIYNCISDYLELEDDLNFGIITRK